MKFKLLNIALATLLLGACADDPKKQEKDLLDEIIKLHDKAMANDERAVKTKIKLDSLIKVSTQPANKDSVGKIATNLTVADQAMEDWMHHFDAENTDKSHDEKMQYLSEQKKKLNQVDKQLETAIDQANKYISTTKK